MTIRKRTENYETENLSEYAAKSSETKGRKKPCDKCDVRTDFQRDRDRITHSKAFRRLMHKTQVFIFPDSDHCRTRLTHTIEVSQISRAISRALRLNDDLTEAIALGHDLGHTPFGHIGENVLAKLNPYGFEHNSQSVRILEYLENGGKGLNLTAEVLDGIFNHRSKLEPKTLEGKVVQLSDKIAYVNHDIDDAVRAGLIKMPDLPKSCIDILGDTASDRINTLINSIIENSMDKNYVTMDTIVSDALKGLRKFMFENVYLDGEHLKNSFKVEHTLKGLYDYYMGSPQNMPAEYISMWESGKELPVVVCDYVAGMTDRYVLKIYSDMFMPADKVWQRGF
ncbi:MAG: deoxyguanosinetriphosphate triphosphohydrolase [Defluviitaleaceae bacterium]|nr:deoxyguanosinetriphosphate triphosphohydrolase [Defluviitaleaceae bacterium]